MVAKPTRGPTEITPRDGSSRIASVTDWAGRSTYYEYDEERLVRVRAPEGCVGYYAYDESDALTQITDPDGHTAYYEYDTESRVVRERPVVGCTGPRLAERRIV